MHSAQHINVRWSEREEERERETEPDWCWAKCVETLVKTTHLTLASCSLCTAKYIFLSARFVWFTNEWQNIVCKKTPTLRSANQFAWKNIEQLRWVCVSVSVCCGRRRRCRRYPTASVVHYNNFLMRHANEIIIIIGIQSSKQAIGHCNGDRQYADWVVKRRI